MTDRDIQDAPIRWKVAGAGFLLVGQFVALIDRDPDPFPLHRLRRPEGGEGGPRDDVPGDLGHRMDAGGQTHEATRQALAERHASPAPPTT